MINYIVENPNQVIPALLEHIQLTVVSVAISFLIAFPIGVLISKKKKYNNVTNSVVNFLYAIPTLAMFAALIPFLGLGASTAITSLVVYNQYILIKNISEGFNEVDKSVLESASAMGMSDWQRFWKVEIPLAMPLILSGLKLASLGTVSGATLAASVAGGGLGRLLISGMAMQKWGKVRAATLLCALIAIALTAFFHILEEKALRHAKGDL